MLKAAACFILYNPPKESAENLMKVLPFCDKVYVADNSKTILIDKNSFGAYSHKITYLHSGKNEGIAKRLNEICTLATQDGFQWLLTMDQDSYFEKSELEKYLHSVAEYKNKETVSMFGVSYESPLQGDNMEQVQELITSGSLVNLELFKEVGGFNEDYFIDQVDTEYCLRSIRKGYNVMKATGVFMNHQLGQESNHISLKSGKRTKRTLHSPQRLYYMTRNFLFLQKQYAKLFPQTIKKHKKALLNEYKNNLLYNKERIHVLKFIIIAIYDYSKGIKGSL